MTPEFKRVVETFGPRLKTDLGLRNIHVAAVFGNGAVESAQYRTLQEIAPTVRGSRGGYGWFQWTGPRRRAFEAWCKLNALKPSDPEANYGYLGVELRGMEKASVTALRRTTTLDTATKVFMDKFERPGVPHLNRRKGHALEVLHVLEAVVGVDTPVVPVVPVVAVGDPVVATGAPRVTTVAPAGRAPSLLSVVAGKLGLGPKHVGVPVVIGSVGDPTIFYVQKTLREKVYYTKGLLDGLDGGMTQSAVAQARKDNGLGDGGIDAAFLAALPGMPQRPVSAERASVTLAQAAEHAPELFSTPSWLWKAGLGAIGLGGMDSANSGGLLAKVSDGVGKANDVFGSVQTALGYVASAVSFVVEHRTIILIVIGALLVWKAVSATLSAWIKVRQAFF